MDPVRRRGPRPAGEDTRAAILDAARTEFATRGYEGATLRGIARVAGVDPRLVHHYFDGKDAVFAAAMQLPGELVERIPAALAGDVEGLGERLVRVFFSIWDPPEGREQVVALVSSVLTSPRATTMLREFLLREILGRIVASLGSTDPELRASLAASQMVGLVMTRYVVRLEPMASVDPETVIRLVAPTLQRYLVGDLGAEPEAPGPPGTPR